MISYHDEYFGCVTEIPCKHCGAIDISYDDLVNDSRWDKSKHFINYWLFRKWYPQKCYCCGRRYKHDETVDHIPF